MRTTIRTWIVEPKYDDVGCFIGDMVRVKIDGKYGYIDKSGTMIVEPKFDGAGNFRDGIAAVKVVIKK